MVRFITDPRGLDVSTAPPPGLQVIGAGLPRAATSSMQEAFEQLGYTPCLHMAQIIPHASRMRLFLAAIREEDPPRRQKLVRELVGGHVAMCDLPVVFFTADLLDLYPDARLVLNGRPSAEAWAASCRASLGFFFSRRFYWTGLLWPTDRLWYEVNMEVLRYCRRTWGTDDPFNADAYRRYYDGVRAEAAKRGIDVLEFKAEDGWEPLCRHLAKDVPDAPFPRANEAKIFAIIKAIIVARGLAAWGVLGLAGWGGWWLVRRYLRE